MILPREDVIIIAMKLEMSNKVELSFTKMLVFCGEIRALKV